MKFYFFHYFYYFQSELIYCFGSIAPLFSFLTFSVYYSSVVLKVFGLLVVHLFVVVLRRLKTRDIIIAPLFCPVDCYLLGVRYDHSSRVVFVSASVWVDGLSLFDLHRSVAVESVAPCLLICNAFNLLIKAVYPRALGLVLRVTFGVFMSLVVASHFGFVSGATFVVGSSSNGSCVTEFGLLFFSRGSSFIFWTLDVCRPGRQPV